MTTLEGYVNYCRSQHTATDNGTAVSKRKHKKAKASSAPKNTKGTISTSTPIPTDSTLLQVKKTQKTSESTKKFEEDPFKIRVNINKIVSPDEIYVSEASKSASFEKMRNSVQNFYKAKTISNWSGHLQPGANYCVYSPRDREYCRAEFMGMSEDEPNKAKMLLVDLAVVENMEIQNIQPLNQKFLATPKHIFKIKLADIVPCDGVHNWPSSTCNRLQDIMSGDVKCYITLVDQLEVNEGVPVDLTIRRNVIIGPLEPSRKETVSVARWLIEEGLALPR